MRVPEEGKSNPGKVKRGEMQGIQRDSWSKMGISRESKYGREKYDGVQGVKTVAAGQGKFVKKTTKSEEGLPSQKEVGFTPFHREENLRIGTKKRVWKTLIKTQKSKKPGYFH